MGRIILVMILAMYIFHLVLKYKYILGDYLVLVVIVKEADHNSVYIPWEDICLLNDCWKGVMLSRSPHRLPISIAVKYIYQFA